MTPTAARERSTIFVRCNFERPDHAPGIAEPPSGRPARSFEAAAAELQGLIEQAIRRIKRREAAEASLRELASTLSRMEAIVARDPGTKMAANDLYDAAAALVMAHRTGAAALDVRLWRLLNEADSRLRARLTSARPLMYEGQKPGQGLRFKNGRLSDPR